MSKVVRTTHEHDGEIAVFLIGFRINQLRRVRQWLPVALAMAPMLKELKADPDSGLLHHELLLGPRGGTVVQYWRSTEDIYAYARDEGRRHRPAWLAFFTRAAAHPEAVGIWHETYAVPAGHHESVYGAMPPHGLAAATRQVAVTGRTETARQRMGAA